MLDSPIFLFCSERSGSNLISKIFDAHPEICAPGASHLFKVMSECACKYPQGSDDLRDAVKTLFHAKVSHWTLDDTTENDLDKLLSRLNRADEMAAALYDAEALANGKRQVFVKENSAFRYLHVLQGQSITPKFLFMVRDPRDMALSWKQGPAMRGGVLRATRRWMYDQLGYLEALPHLPAGTPVSFLRYEDLLAAPDQHCCRICNELGIEFDESMMEFQTRSGSAKANAKRSAMWSNIDKPLIADNSQKFLKGLDDDEIAYIEAVAGPIMKTFGYVSARRDKPPYAGSETLEQLESKLGHHEPYEKPAYQELPIEERTRFENWSRLYKHMSDLPHLPVEQLRAPVK